MAIPPFSPQKNRCRLLQEVSVLRRNHALEKISRFCKFHQYHDDDIDAQALLPGISGKQSAEL
jgi:hypothetical protein